MKKNRLTSHDKLETCLDGIAAVIGCRVSGVVINILFDFIRRIPYRFAVWIYYHEWLFSLLNGVLFALCGAVLQRKILLDKSFRVKKISLIILILLALFPVEFRAVTGPFLSLDEMKGYVNEEIIKKCTPKEIELSTNRLIETNQTHRIKGCQCQSAKESARMNFKK